jgi:glucose/arabinose dehydrogenase
MKKILIVIIAILVVGAASYGAWYYYKNLRGAGPAVRPPSGDIGNVLPPANQPLPDGVNNTEYPLKVPQGFAISIYAKNLPGARVMAIDAFNNMWVSQTSQGKISQIENSTGKVNEIFKNLNRPHGLAIDPENGLTLYIAEETKISRVPLYSDGPMEKIIDLPKGGRHYTRTLEFGPDGRLYVSIGSTCDVCNEKDEKVAAIYSMNKDGSDFKKIASGLRNSVFFDWSYVDGKMWATEMGRDNLGDNFRRMKSISSPQKIFLRTAVAPPSLREWGKACLILAGRFALVITCMMPISIKIFIFKILATTNRLPI